MRDELLPQAWATRCAAGINIKVHEDKITNPLVRELKKIKRNTYPEAAFRIEGQYQVNPAEGDEGKVDIAVTFGGDEELYLAYECKWLEKGNHSQKVALYLGEEGLERFLTGKYASEMPVGHMVGYVASGKVEAALERMWKAMKKRGITTDSTAINTQPLQWFQTQHERHSQDADISITHILLPCNSS